MRVELLAMPMTPMMVKSQPLPIALIIGAATKDPIQENMLRMKLFNATPADAFFGMNSVNIVVAMLKISIDPMPKKKFPSNCSTGQKVSNPIAVMDSNKHTGINQKTPLSIVQP